MHLSFNSYYSLRYGTIPVDKLPSLALQAGAEAALLTDINNSTGIIDFVKACNKEGVKPIAGMEFHDGNRLLYTGIAENNEGFRELNELMSRSNMNHLPLPHTAPPFKNVLVVYPWGSRRSTELADNEYIGVTPSDITKLPLSDYNKYRGKYIIHAPATFINEEEYEVHRYLRAIDNNILLSKLTPDMVAGSDRMLRTHGDLVSLFSNFPELIRNTERITGRCNISFDFKTIKNKKTFTGSTYDDRLLLEKLASDGLLYRYGADNKEAKRRVRHELDIIDRLWFLFLLSDNMGYYKIFYVAGILSRWTRQRGK